MLTDHAAVRISNPMRYLVPAGTAILVLGMFVVPVAMAGVSGTKVVAGAAVLSMFVVWLLWSAWVAPFELAIAATGLDVRRWSGNRAYRLDRVRKWWFAVPDGPPTELPPSTNAVLYVVFDDRTRFRAEVTSDEASRVAVLLQKR